MAAALPGCASASQGPGCEVNGTFDVMQSLVAPASGTCAMLPLTDTFLLSSGVDGATTFTATGVTLGGSVCAGNLTSTCAESDTDCESTVAGDTLSMDFTITFDATGFTGSVSVRGEPSGCTATYAETGVREK
jgi:hypothetical protein